ncbi:unnamed protein product, partial [Phaeothamnion confervicola]
MHGAGAGPQPLLRQGSHPLRPGAIDCMYYMKTGLCKFGSGCRFNHPINRPASAEDGKRMRLPCQLFLDRGACPFGEGCTFRHVTLKQIEQEEKELGTVVKPELPLRPGMLPCKFYMKTGKCAYGNRCKWHHP